MSPIDVDVEIDGETVSAGQLFSTIRRGRLASSFGYAPEFIGRAGAYALEPALPLSSGSWALQRSLPRSFDDAAPDRWGRNLIAKRIRAEAPVGEAARQIDDRDFLLGVSDVSRQGALRFSLDGEFQHPSLDVPKLIALPELLDAAREVARDGADDLAAVKFLLDAGTGSLGGARPKASVRDGDRLTIAKFPHHSDEWSVIAWEKTALSLAADAGITVPNIRLVGVHDQPVLLLERFDRDGPARIGYISAMTLLEADDGSPRDYLEIADALTDHGASPSADLHELWRRLAFSIAIHNTDDHLRNHGFLRRRGGWRLAPAFDVNPNPDASARRVTGIGGAADPAAEVRVLLDYASSFDLTVASAKAILADVVDAARRWADEARRNGVPASELERFRPTLESTIGVVAAAASRTSRG
ncbi:type II toxin-antitoxin system HipA family toxin [Microbacteriaceae bacterium VKM Ac-2854]|nr:type II toxin-antitoxin system HipA family toxin [Microbacteriaceae bacterium VKM Ac-2854]